MRLLTIFISLFTVATVSLMAMSDPPEAQRGAKQSRHNSKDAMLRRIKLPPGFDISYFARKVKGARSLTLGAKGTVFVSTRGTGYVYALVDQNRDGKADKKIILARGLNMPNGIAFHQGDLYVAEVHRILRFRNIEQGLKQYPKYEVFFTGLPSETHHGWRYLRIRNNKIYIGVGAPCNICHEKNYAQIRTIDMKSKRVKVIARGVRNTVGFDFNPKTGSFWFSDNGRDMMGDDVPPDEINKLSKTGEHFGYPFCHGSNVIDPKFGKADSCGQYTKPQVNLGAHVAPLGIRFYTGKMFPQKYRNQLFVAEHGSWNRSTKAGYRLQVVTIKKDRAVSVKPFATGWMSNETTYGRPVDFLVLPDGSLLVSDDYRSAIYRIVWKKP